jgi:hypothetical protein
VLGWAIDDAPAAVRAVAEWLDSGRSLVEAAGVMLVCETSQLETVYVENRDGRLLVSDRGETCRQLETEDWPYRRLPLDTVRRLCGERGAVLAEVEEMWPHITVDPATVDTVVRAVAVVAAATEHVFAAALIVSSDG